MPRDCCYTPCLHTERRLKWRRSAGHCLTAVPFRRVVCLVKLNLLVRGRCRSLYIFVGSFLFGVLGSLANRFCSELMVGESHTIFKERWREVLS